MAPKKDKEIDLYNWPALDTPAAIELEFKRMQIEVMREQMAERIDRKVRLTADRERLYRDFRKMERDISHRQTICQHRKGGRNNNFAKGNAADYSIVMNTYPDGSQVVFCTRCLKEVKKPVLALKREDPAAYKEAWKIWVEWTNLPTDNTPSGSKIFEIEKQAA